MKGIERFSSFRAVSHLVIKCLEMKIEIARSEKLHEHCLQAPMGIIRDLLESGWIGQKSALQFCKPVRSTCSAMKFGLNSKCVQQGGAKCCFGLMCVPQEARDGCSMVRSLSNSTEDRHHSKIM